MIYQSAASHILTRGLRNNIETFFYFSHTFRTTTTTHDPIADHVNLLLQQYFSTQTPDVDNSDKGVPMITYDDENNSIVMEYLSPDGSTSSTKNQEQNENFEPKQEVAETVPNFFPQPDNAGAPILPVLNSSPETVMEVLDRVFEPSQKTGNYFK